MPAIAAAADSKQKLDELFLYWLSLPKTEEVLQKDLQCILAGEKIPHHSGAYFNTPKSPKLAPHHDRNHEQPEKAHPQTVKKGSEGDVGRRRRSFEQEEREEMMVEDLLDVETNQTKTKASTEAAVPSSLLGGEGGRNNNQSTERIETKGENKKSSSSSPSSGGVNAVMVSSGKSSIEDALNLSSDSFSLKDSGKGRHKQIDISGADSSPMITSKQSKRKDTSKTKNSKEEIPQFYFPRGVKTTRSETVNKELMKKAKQLFMKFDSAGGRNSKKNNAGKKQCISVSGRGEGGVGRGMDEGDFLELVKLFRLPTYWNGVLFRYVVNRTRLEAEGEKQRQKEGAVKSDYGDGGGGGLPYGEYEDDFEGSEEEEEINAELNCGNEEEDEDVLVYFEEFEKHVGLLLSSCFDAASRFAQLLKHGCRPSVYRRRLERKRKEQLRASSKRKGMLNENNCLWDDKDDLVKSAGGGRGNCSTAQIHLTREDFIVFVEGIISRHPGLVFLKDTPEFQQRYIETVIERIFYKVNRSWSGKISLGELKRSRLLDVIEQLDLESDINKTEDFFSYEHFYVIYCKFWELDTDHDLIIDKQDLLKHADYSLSSRIVGRILSGAVTTGFRKQNRGCSNSNGAEDEGDGSDMDHSGRRRIGGGGVMTYREFVWFLLSEEDKKTGTSIEYWFRCMDMDGDGIISMYELEYFYEEQYYRMGTLAVDSIPFEDCICQVLDMIKPVRENHITLGDLKRSKMTGLFFNLFFNLHKFLDFEQKDPFAAKHEAEENSGFLTDWDIYAAKEYAVLAEEE
eukprot:Nk52_evm6s116 gene=Nk52_evmTU6s116